MSFILLAAFGTISDSDFFLIFSVFSIVFLLYNLIPSSLIYLILYKSINKNPKFFEIYIGSALLPIIPITIIFPFINIAGIEILFLYATLIITSLLGGYVGPPIFKSIKKSKKQLRYFWGTLTFIAISVFTSLFFFKSGSVFFYLTLIIIYCFALTLTWVIYKLFIKNKKLMVIENKELRKKVFAIIFFFISIFSILFYWVTNQSRLRFRSDNYEDWIIWGISLTSAITSIYFFTKKSRN